MRFTRYAEQRGTNGRETITATVRDLDEAGSIPTNLREFILWLEEAIAELPEAMRDSATIKLTATYGCDDCSREPFAMTIIGERLENDAEFAERMEKEGAERQKAAKKRAERAAAKAIEREENERAEYQRLKEKFSK